MIKIILNILHIKSSRTAEILLCLINKSFGAEKREIIY